MSADKTGNNFSWKRVILKGLLLFIIIDLLFSAFTPLSTFGKISAYNVIFPGRLRLPYGEKPDQAYNISLFNLDAMFASHELAAFDKPDDEFRVFLIGDSSVWGYLLKPENTLTEYINAAQLHVADGRTVHAYNLGYPTMSLAKDLLILSYAMRYQPDAIIWLVTLESFPLSKQLDSPIVQNNPKDILELIRQYSLNLNPQDSKFVLPNFLESTLVGQRRAFADIIRLQLYGVLWAATGIDQYYPDSFEPPQENLTNDESFHGLLPPRLVSTDLSIDLLSAGNKIANGVPIIFVNEPIYLSHGENSDIRYNFFYPRWAYDQYRQLFEEYCQKNSWQCLDEWDLVPPSEFTNSAIHMSPQGTQQLASQIENALRSLQKP
jgi:hypothetical protein